MLNSIQGPQWRTRLGWLLTGGIVSAGIRGAHDNTHLGSLLVDPYWVGFYVTNFQDGFRRRALIGSLCRLIQPNGMSVVLINVLAILALVAVLALFVRSFLRLTDGGTALAPLFAFALFGSAIISVFFEVLGDTLQIAFLAFALFTLIPARFSMSRVWRLGLALAGLVVAFFVHEASAFLLAPCIPFLAGTRARLRDFAMPAVALAMLVLLSMHWSHLTTHLTYHAISIPAGMPLENLAATPGFLELLRLERVDDFGSRSKLLFFLIKCASITGLGLAGCIAAANSFSAATLRRFLICLGYLLLLSSPLWIIAHDWGRFLGYVFFLSALCTAASAASPDHTADQGNVGWVERLGRNEGFRCAALLLLLASPYDQSRIFGMHIRDLLSSLFVVMVGLAMLLMNNRSAYARTTEQVR